MLNLGAVLVLATTACGDPLRDGVRDALGDEQPGFEPGQYHRPGQPCLVCHSDYGGEEPTLSVGGTLFHLGDGEDPYMVGAEYVVRLFDSEGVSFDAPVNACGNFLVKQSDFNPAYPMRATLFAFANGSVGAQVQVMQSRIGREGSCARCHIHDASPYSPGVVYVPGQPTSPPPSKQGSCPPPWLGPDPFAPRIEP